MKNWIFSLMIFKRQIPEFNLSSDWRLTLNQGRIGNQRLDFENGIESFQTGSASLIKINNIPKRDEGPDQTREINVENIELSHRNLPTNDRRNNAPNNQHK